MKISCQSCEAKYTIADEKVRGKVVKIRCKKCSATIIVKGTELAPPDYDDAPTRVLDRDEFASGDGRPSDEWTLSVSDDDQRTVSSEELVALYRSGTIDDDTFAWRDGMEDWLPLRDIQELRNALAQGRASHLSAPAASAVAAPSPPPVSSSSSKTGPRAAVRRPESGRGATDLFGAAALAGSDADASLGSKTPTPGGDSSPFTGARNENSVLFSLSALTGATPSTQAAAETESSSIIDINNLMGPSPSARPKASPASKVEDIMNLGGTGIFAASFAAPPVESAPPAHPGSGSTASSAPSEKSNKGLLFGVLGLLGVCVLGAGAYFAFAGSGESPAPTAQTAPTNAPESTPTPTAPAAPEAADDESSAAAKVDEGKEAADTASPTPKETQLAAAAPAPADVEPAVAREKEKAPPPAPAKVADKPAPKAPAPPPAKPAPPPPKPAAPAASDTPPFNRAAALSSLNAASDSAAAACKKPGGPTGSGRIAVTFAPNGVVTTANVEGPPFAGTAVGSCIAAKFRSARVPAFAGGIVTVRKSFTIN